MDLPLLILILIGSMLGLCYVMFIGYFSKGWLLLGKKRYQEVRTAKVSVIVAARNESLNILPCLRSLVAQNYPAENVEIIVVDDHSEDNTAELVSSFAALHPNVKLISAGPDCIGKKQAIRTGIGNSSGSLIITTDADCTMGPDWITAVVSCQSANDYALVAGPVVYTDERSGFQRMQSLEFMALIASSGGSLAFGKPTMCNGANLAYTREAYESVGGFSGTEGKASGDDVLLMYRIGERFPGKLTFIRDKRAIVSTHACASLSGFLDQRRRWASKGLWAMNPFTRILALDVYFFCFFIVFGPLIDWICYRDSSFYLLLTGFCLILAGIKCFIDFLLLFLSASFFGKERLLLLFLPEQILYVFYVVLTGMLGSFGKYEWKGRKTN